eukprot:SAG31_NODE_11911_length_987_cov_0.825450_3_plen_67_part_00
MLPQIDYGTPIEIRIEKIGLKDASDYNNGAGYKDPFIRVKLVNAAGIVVGTEQSTPGPTKVSFVLR